jgi:glutathione S-transferase
VVEEASWKCIVFDAVKTFDDPRERWVFEEMQMRKRGPLEVLALQKQTFLKALVSTLAPAEDRLGETPYLLGAEPSLADFALYGALHPLPFTGNALPKETPHVREWFGRVQKLATPKKG